MAARVRPRMVAAAVIDRFKGAMTACRVTPPGWLTDFKRNPVMAVIAVVKQGSVPDMQHALRYVPHRIARGEPAQKFLNPGHGDW